MLAFLYFVQMLNNLPKMLMISWNNMMSLPKCLSSSSSSSSSPSPNTSLRLEITVISETPPILWMTPDDVTKQAITVNVSICHVATRWVSWKLDDDVTRESAHCSRVFRLEAIHVAHRVTATMLKAHGVAPITISGIIHSWKPFWIAAIGDSFSSGQGNPDVAMEHGKPAKWLDDKCYRSSKAFPYQISSKIPKSVLTFLSCSGATVDHGILSKNGQMEHLEKMINARGASPDVLFLTIGGNDIGFGDVISMVQRDTVDEKIFDMRFFFVSHQIDRVAWKLRDLNITRVVLLDYYDVTRNEDGVVDASCGAFGQVSLSNLQLAERKILRNLNNLLRRKSLQYGWITVSTTDIFRTRGSCSKCSLIRSRNESLDLQGNEYGSFHPNEEAHRRISNQILKTLKL